MDNQHVFELLQKYITISNPDLKDYEMSLNDSFETLGINSLDKMAITTQLISELSLSVSLADIFFQRDLNSLVNLLVEKSAL